MVKALGKTLHSEVSLPECAGRIFLPAGWAGSLAPGTVWEVQWHLKPFPLALLLPQAHKSLSLFPFLLGSSQEQEQGLVYSAKDGRKPPPLLTLTTSGETNTPSVILRQFSNCDFFFENLLSHSRY